MPILPPMASVRSSLSTGLPVWDLCHTFSGEQDKHADATGTPPPGAKADTCSSAGASPSNTVPNTPSLGFSTTTVRTVTPPPALSVGEADESDQESSATTSDTDKHVNDVDDDAHSMQEDDKNSPVYTGVSRSGLNGRWRAQLSTRGRTVHLGTFASGPEAARAWDRAAVQERGKAAVTNFALSNYINSDGSIKSDAGTLSQGGKGQRDDENTTNPCGHKSFRGVYHSGTYGRWKARIVVKGHKIHLGTFASAEDAARAWDLKALEYRGAGTVTNFDSCLYSAGKEAAPRGLEDHDSDDFSTGKRNRSNGATSPCPSELSDLSTPRHAGTRVPSDSRAKPSSSKRRKHASPKAHAAAASKGGYSASKGGRHMWEFLGEEKEEGDEESEVQGQSTNRADGMALSSLLSLCAAAEAMS